MADQKTYTYKSKYGKTYKLRLGTGHYYNDSLAVTADCLSTDYGSPWWEPYANITVNIEPKSDAFVGTTKAFVDTNNLGEGIVAWLEDNGIAKATGRVARSGYCTYPEVEFSAEALDLE